MFADGTHPVLSGVQVVADDIITITVDHNYLPFFYEMGLLSCTPFPIYAIAPGVVVRDDGEGVYLANEDAAIDEPVFTEELLRSTILDPESGFLYLPNIGSGPYVIKSFDGTTAEFELNPWYKGDADDRLPLVQRLTYTLADNETMVEKLATGEYDVLNKVTKSTTINEAMMLMRGGDYLTEDGQRAYHGQTGGNVPLVKSLSHDDFWHEQGSAWSDKNYDAFVSYPDQTLPTNVVTLAPQEVADLFSSSAMQALFTNVLSGKMDVLTAFNQLQTKANEKWKTIMS